MASDGPSPHSPSLRLGLPAHQSSRRHHALSLLGPSFYDPRKHHVLESHPERAAPLSRRDDERCHATGSHSALALRLYVAAYYTSSSCRFLVLDHLCSNLSQSFHPISPSLRFGLPAPQPSRRHHAQSLLGPSFHDPRTHHVFESHPEQVAPLSRLDDERCHANGSHSILALHLHLAACSPSSSCRF